MRRLDLVSDCGNCAALCCTAPSFDASEDFAIAKSAGTPCPHLADDHRCKIHPKLGERGFLGCAIYDCYGAGPRVTRVMADGTQAQRNAAFLAARVVHELLWQLLEAEKLCAAEETDLAQELGYACAELEQLVQLPPAHLVALDLEAHEVGARALLRRVGQLLRRRRKTRAFTARDRSPTRP